VYKRQAIDPDKMDDIRGLLKDKEKNLEKYVQGFRYKTLTSQDGKPAIEFTILSTDDTKDVAGTYNIVLNQQMNTMLKDLPQNTGQYMYGQLLRGKTVKSNPVMAASGFWWELVPGDTSDTQADPETATLALHYNTRVNEKGSDGVIKSVIKPVSVEKTFNLKGDNQKSPDEIVGMLTDLYRENMLNNNNAQLEYQAYLKAHTGTPPGPGVPATVTKEEMMKKLGL
jgi:hypothetical protein